MIVSCYLLFLGRFLDQLLGLAAPSFIPQGCPPDPFPVG